MYTALRILFKINVRGCFLQRQCHAQLYHVCTFEFQTITSYSPTTNEPIAHLKQASPADYDKVVEASREAYQHWCEVSVRCQPLGGMVRMGMR